MASQSIAGASGPGALKDTVLAALGSKANVAQFVSFSPARLDQRHSLIHGFDPDFLFESPREAIAALLRASPERRVNVRSFDPRKPKNNEFIYGLGEVDAALNEVVRLVHMGAHTIVNETIDVHDGGVSGVCVGGICEFAPDDTPRCVEKPGTAAMPLAKARSLLKSVYGFEPALDYPPTERVEFSVHPLRRGFHRDHTIIWELEQTEAPNLVAIPQWPNLFSRMLGDKAFGLLVADAYGFAVPRATVVSRRVAPFAFGRHTHTGEVWLRTSPAEQTPGRFTTTHGWTDPYKLLQEEDPKGNLLASVISQEGVDALYSGAVATDAADQVVIEGVGGSGDPFMGGKRGPEDIPSSILRRVKYLHRRAFRIFGPIRMEWAADQRRVWIIQLHRGGIPGGRSLIFPGNPVRYRRFEVDLGIEALRALLPELQERNEGVILVGQVGVTSHFGDLLRLGKIPSRVEY